MIELKIDSVIVKVVLINKKKVDADNHTPYSLVLILESILSRLILS